MTGCWIDLRMFQGSFLFLAEAMPPKQQVFTFFCSKPWQVSSSHCTVCVGYRDGDDFLSLQVWAEGKAHEKFANIQKISGSAFEPGSLPICFSAGQITANDTNNPTSPRLSCTMNANRMWRHHRTEKSPPANLLFPHA